MKSGKTIYQVYQYTSSNTNDFFKSLNTSFCSTTHNKQTKDSKSSKNEQTHTIKMTTFVLKEVRSPVDIKIDKHLQSVFQKLNQSYSTSINTPHSSFLQQQIDDFFHTCQTHSLFPLPPIHISQTTAEAPNEDTLK